MTKKTLYRALASGFKALKERGYFAEQDWTCCHTCGCAEIPDEFNDRYVFYHDQDAYDLRESGETYVSWAGDGQEIVEVFRAEGLRVEWDGSRSTRILIGSPLLH
jgi:Domain of unknown function (DUF6891)